MSVMQRVHFVTRVVSVSATEVHKSNASHQVYFIKLRPPTFGLEKVGAFFDSTRPPVKMATHGEEGGLIFYKLMYSSKQKSINCLHPTNESDLIMGFGFQRIHHQDLILIPPMSITVVGDLSGFLHHPGHTSS